MKSNMKQKFILAFFGVVIFTALLGLSPRVARADSVITNCGNDSQLTTALASGGVITFNCGKAAITLSGQKTINVDTTIDGGGKITLSGGKTTRLFWVNSGKSLTLKNLVLVNGYSGSAYGGCIYVDEATLVVQKTYLQNCRTNGYDGGAIVSPNSNVTLENAVLQQNSASAGAAVSATGTLTIQNSVLQDNVVTIAGGAVSAGGAIQIDSSLFRDNRATNSGARGGAIAIVAGALLNLNDSTLSGNTAIEGGAIYVAANSTMNLSRSTLNGNTATKGGGIYALGTFSMVNATLSGNTASSRGGGILLDGTAGVVSATLLNVTLAGNSAPSWGGLAMSLSGSFSYLIRNTIFAKGPQGSNCDLTFGLPGFFNLSDDNSCGFGAGRDNATLNLGPLAYNGSSTQTHLLLPGSAALNNASNSTAPATDQRGSPRPQGTAADVGAVEVCTVKPNKPALASPLNNKKYKGTQVALNWDDTPCADKYKITVKDAATGKKVQSGNSGTSDFKTKALTKGKSYLWFVQACNSIGCTKSDTWQFKIK